MRQLTSLDAQFLAFEDGRTHGHVSVLGTYAPMTADGRSLSAEVIIELVTERLPLLPPFRWRLARVPFDVDHPYWEDSDDVDVAAHVHTSTLPAGDDRELAEHVAQIIAQPLDRSRPLWEIHVINGLADGSVGVLMKMHHAAVDGVSGAEILSALLDQTPDGRDVPVAVPTGRRQSDFELFGRGLLNACRHPVRALEVAARALPHLDQVPTLSALPGIKALARSGRRGRRTEASAMSAPRTRFQAPVSGERSVAFGSVSLNDVKAVKEHFGCSVNDVVIAMCSAGLRSWLDANGELPDRPLVSFVPVSVRTKEQAGTFGNRVSVMMAELPTDEADAAVRLKRVKAELSAAKLHHKTLPPSLMQDANDLVPPALFARTAGAALRFGASPLLQPAVNVAISNVPGSPTTLFCAGAEQRTQYPISGVMHGIGLNITVFSYRDALGIGIVADRGQLDDAWPLLGAIQDALPELARLVPTM